MATQQPDPQLTALTLAYQRQTDQLRQSLADTIRRIWLALRVYREPQMRTFASQVTPVVLGGQRQIAALTAAYLARQRQLAVGGTSVPIAVDPSKVTGPAVRNGVSSNEVYERPFHLVWRQLDELPRKAGSIDQAITAGLDRAVSSALTDLQLTKRATAHNVMADDREVTGYRRVLEGEHSCGLCIVASTQRYHKGDLLPIHPGCDCGVVEIFGESDPGQIIDPLSLDGVHDRILDRFGVNARDARAIPSRGLPDYKDILIVHHHGELGPVLGVRGEPFLGPDDLRQAA